MASDEATLKRQLDQATVVFSAWVKTLDEQGVASTARRKNAKWRQLNAKCNAIKKRLKAQAAIIARNNELAQRKAERLAAPPEEKAPKPKAAAKPKPAKDKSAPKDKPAVNKKEDRAGKEKEKKK